MSLPIVFIILFFMSFSAAAQDDAATSGFVVARVKYNGGGDWYNDPSIIPNLLSFMRLNTNVEVGSTQRIVEISDQDLFNYPVIFMTGHGNIFFSDDEAERLRIYLTGGGFLFADDDYGMDKAFRREIKKVFPHKDLIELPFSHPVFNNHFAFPEGAPKIHEHDGGSPKSFGLFHQDRLIVYYTFNTNISDGWADETVHNDPPEVRRKALKMGTNIMVYALTH